MDNQPPQQPAQQPDPNPNPAVQTPVAAQPAPATQSTQPPAQPAPAEPASANQPQQSGWKFNGNDPSANPQNVASPEIPAPNPITTEIAWSASEYVHHEKDAKWYLAYSAVSLSILGIVYLLTRDEISVGILAILAVGFGVFAARKPETLDYRIDASGVHIGPKLYPVTMFKSFAVVEEGSINSIALMPLKRFMPPITMYCAPEDEKKVEEALGAMLPQETKEQDRVDKLMHKVGF